VTRPDTIRLLDDDELRGLLADDTLAADAVVSLGDGREVRLRGMLTFSPDQAQVGELDAATRTPTLAFVHADCQDLNESAEVRIKGFRYQVREVVPGTAGLDRARLKRVRGPADVD